MQINANLEAKLWGEKFLVKNIVKTVKQADQPWRILVSRSVKNFYFKVPYKQFLKFQLILF